MKAKSKRTTGCSAARAIVTPPLDFTTTRALKKTPKMQKGDGNVAKELLPI